jgi:hypothetical protein
VILVLLFTLKTRGLRVAAEGCHRPRKRRAESRRESKEAVGGVSCVCFSVKNAFPRAGSKTAGVTRDSGTETACFQRLLRAVRMISTGACTPVHSSKDAAP